MPLLPLKGALHSSSIVSCLKFLSLFKSLLQALIFADANAIKENSVKLGAGEDLYALFAGILTMRPWNRVVDTAVDHLVIQGDDNERSELQVITCPFFHFQNSVPDVHSS